MVQCRSCNFDNTDDAKTCQNCGTAINGVDVTCGIPTFAGSSVNQVLDRRYIIVREIAASRIGVTYEAEDAELNTQVIYDGLDPAVARSKFEAAKKLIKTPVKRTKLDNSSVIMKYIDLENIRLLI